MEGNGKKYRGRTSDNFDNLKRNVLHMFKLSPDAHLRLTVGPTVITENEKLLSLAAGARRNNSTLEVNVSILKTGLKFVLLPTFK